MHNPSALPRARRRRRLAALAVVLGGALAATAALAQPAGYYQVEVVIFSQPPGSAELPPRPRTAGPLVAADPALQPDPDREPESMDDVPVELEAGADSWLPEGFSGPRLPLRLDSAATRLNRGGYQLLWHQAWVQPPTDDGAIDLALLAALGRGPATPDLSGSIHLSSARFVHLGLHLQWQSAGTLAAELRQRRRVRPSVQHYYDHPRLGVIAVITPVADAGQPRSP